MPESRLSAHPCNLLTRLLIALVVPIVFSTPAWACGASGGNNAQQDVLRCDPNSPPANHRGVGTKSATAHSIDLITGNKYFAHTDAVWPGGLRFTRHYNSRNTFEQALGPSWRHSYETALAFSKTDDGQWRVQIIQADGRRIVFKPTRVSDLYQSVQPGYGTVVYQRNAGTDRRFVWRWLDGSTLSFDQTGKLRATEQHNGQKLSLSYHSDQLSHVTNRHGQSLRFNYQRNRLVSVVLPNSHTLQFEFDPQKVLISVNREAVTLWEYQYSDTHLSSITRVTNPNGKLSAIVRYDASGRAIASSPGATEAVDQSVQLQFKLPASIDLPGQTTVVGGDGKTARYAWRYNPRSQQRELLSSNGEQCAACPATGLVRRYDEQGRLISASASESSNAQGMRRWRYDKIGRLSAMFVQSVDHKSRGFWRRYEYASLRPDANLIAIASPSRAPGKQHRIEFSYNALNQLVARQESGYEPDLTTLKISADQWQIGRWRTIQRTWRYQYHERGAAQGLLETVDGPLPGVSDKTTYRYNDTGYRVEQIQPGNLAIQHKYDQFGFLNSSVSANGDTVRYGRNAQGSVVRVIKQGLRTDYKRDQLEQISGIARSDQPGIELEKSTEGLLTGIRDTDGNTLAMQGRALAQAKPTNKSSSLKTSFLGDAIHVEKPGTGETLTTLLDDFGRQVAAFDSVTGMRRWVYDAADRLVVSSDGHQNPLLRRYDHAGQLVGTVDKRGQRKQTVWRNGKKVRSKEPHQEVHWKFTPNSQNFKQEITYRDPVSNLTFSNPFVVAHQHNDAGQLQTRQLPDGSHLGYRWRSDNTLQAIDLVLSNGQAISLADQLQWLPFTGGQRGLLSAQYGNGTNQTIRLNEKLRVTNVDHGPTNELPKQKITYDSNGKLVAQTINGRKEQFDYDNQGRLQPRPVSDNTPSPTETRWLSDANGRVRWSVNQNGSSWRYVFNNAGERIGKIDINNPSESRWFIYHQRKLFAETDANGNPIAVYLYLDSRPFVMLRYDERTNEQRTPSIYWLHTDHRGLPLAATDTNGDIVWQQRFTPYGQMIPRNHSGSGLHPISTHGTETKTEAEQLEMPLRLPGQYYDKETGLHDNYLRTYDPRTGNYLGPDPLGLRTNGERFAYARHSPMDTTDPLGLYEIDVHYYMTYFLAIAAGIDPDTAQLIAQANHGIDTNNDTEPINTGPNGESSLPLTVFSITNNQTRLLTYHFPLSQYEETRSPNRYEPFFVLRTQTSTNVRNPTSPQLTRLADAYQTANNPCTSAQLLGEYLHAFQDSFAHRDEYNQPFSALIGGLGVGHGFRGHNPDHTYNRGRWQVNEARTLRMEQETYELLSQHGDPSRSIPGGVLERLLTRFNGSGSRERKIGELNTFLANREQGISESMKDFVPHFAAERRTQYLCGSGNAFSSQGVILPSTCN